MPLILPRNPSLDRFSPLAALEQEQPFYEDMQPVEEETLPEDDYDVDGNYGDTPFDAGLDEAPRPSLLARLRASRGEESPDLRFFEPRTAEEMAQYPAGDVYGALAGPEIPFLAEEVRPRAGRLGSTLARTAASALTGGPLADIATELDIPGIDPMLERRRRFLRSVGDVGEVAGESLVPTRPGELALEAIPGVGFGPDVARGGARLARRGAAAVAETEAGQAAARGARRLATEEAGFAKIPSGAEEITEQQANMLRMMGASEEDVARLPRTADAAPLEGPPVEPPLPPSAAVPQPAPGNRFAGPLRPFDEVEREVISGTGIVEQIAAKTGINPSVLRDSPVGRALTAYERQRIAVDELTDVAVSAALDTHAQRFTGRMGRILPINQDGLIEVGSKAAPNVKGRTPWQDVFSRPDSFNLTPVQRAYVDDYRQVVDEIEDLRVSVGLRPLAKTGPAGWGYVPRQVKTVRGVELRRPSSPALQRVYEDAVEGYSRGIRYDRDPRATLELHTKTAYREIAEKQLTDALEPLSVKPSALVPEPVRIRLEEAIKNRRSVERNVRTEIDRLKANLARPANTPRQIELRKKDLAALEQFRNYTGPAQIDAARQQFNVAKNARTKAMEAARKKEAAPASIFGGNVAETIPIAQWRNRFFKREDADALTDAIGRFNRKGAVSPADWAAKGIGTLANYTRFLASVGDFAMPFIQGLPVLARNPVAWGRSTLRHYQAWFDPTVQSRYIRDHLDTFQEMAQNGVPIGDPEFFAALRQGGGLPAGRVLEVLPKGQAVRGAAQQVGRQTFGRFQASYNTGLGVARANLWEASKLPITERAQWVRNMTGGLDARALGVGPNQREVEGMWLAFSPRLLRSTAALIGDAVQPWTPEGRESLRTLAQLAAGATGIYVATGKALGKSDEEIQEGLNPLNGKRFMAHEVNGDWIGVGGQIRSMTQLVARGINDPESLASADPFDNPLLAFYQSRGAPATQAAGGIAEFATGADLAPFEDIDSLPDLVKHLGTSALPFAVQGYLEGQQPFTTGAGLVGARTSAPTLTDLREQEAKARGFKAFGDAPTSVQNEINATERIGGMLSERGPTEYQQTKEAAYAPIEQQNAEAINAFETGNLTKPLPERWAELTQQAIGARGALSAQFSEQFKDIPKDRFDKVLDGYYDVQRKNPDGTPDFEGTEAGRQKYMLGLPADARRWLNDYIETAEGKRDPVRRQYDAYVAKKEGAGYYKEGITQAERETLDRTHPEIDAEGWYWRGGVQGQNPPALQSIEAVELALKNPVATAPNAGAINRTIKLDGLPRPINQDNQSLEAWEYGKEPLSWYLTGELVTGRNFDREADRLARNRFNKAYANLTEEQQKSVAGPAKSNLREAARRGNPEMDAWLWWWGVIDKPLTPQANSIAKRIIAEYGDREPK